MKAYGNGSQTVRKSTGNELASSYENSPETSASLPTDAKARKAIPLYSGLVKYFPKALAAVAEVSRIGGEQHHPGEPLHWDRNKSTDEHDALLRHLWEAGTIDVDGCRHSAKLAWRALSALEKEIEAAQNDRSDGNLM